MSFAEFEISEFEISRVDCIFFLIKWLYPPPVSSKTRDPENSVMQADVRSTLTLKPKSVKKIDICKQHTITVSIAVLHKICDQNLHNLYMVDPIYGIVGLNGLTLSPPTQNMSFGTTFTFSFILAFRKQIIE